MAVREGYGEAAAGVVEIPFRWTLRVFRRSSAMTPDESKRRVQEYRRKALEHFPFKLVETTGDNALSTWQELKSAGQGFPVVLGGDDKLHPWLE
jgi:hypothetical protein